MILHSHQFVRIRIPSSVRILVPFLMRKKYATCSRWPVSLLLQVQGFGWRPGPSPSRPIYQRADTHKQKLEKHFGDEFAWNKDIVTITILVCISSRTLVSVLFESLKDIVLLLW